MSGETKNSNPPTDGSLVDLWIPSVLLILIAITQVILAHTAELSPWKGGGFGMFASTDAPSLRIIHAEALDEHGDIILIDVVAGIDESHWDSIRALPREIDLVQLGRDLLSKRFIQEGEDLRSDYTRILKENPGINLPPHKASDPGAFFRVATEGGKPTASSGLASEQAVRSIRSIKLQWKRIQFDHAEGTLGTETIGRSIVVGDPWPVEPHESSPSRSAENEEAREEKESP